MPDSTQLKNHKRRWYQFSLKTLLIAMTVATVAFGGWVQYRRYRAQENRDRVVAVEEPIKKAIAEIEKLGGEVTSAHELRSQTWLEKQFDDPGGADDPVVGVLKVTRVELSYGTVLSHKGPDLDAVLTYCLDDESYLERFRLWGTMVTDADLECLKRLNDLETLDLMDVHITNAGIEHLKGLTNLRSLNLSGTKVTDEGLKHLKRLNKLQFLHLGNTNISDAGLEYLKGLKSLESLTLTATDVTNEGADKLRQALPGCWIYPSGFFHNRRRNRGVFKKREGASRGSR